MNSRPANHEVLPVFVPPHAPIAKTYGVFLQGRERRLRRRQLIKD